MANEIIAKIIKDYCLLNRWQRIKVNLLIRFYGLVNILKEQ